MQVSGDLFGVLFCFLLLFWLHFRGINEKKVQIADSLQIIMYSFVYLSVLFA